MIISDLSHFEEVVSEAPSIVGGAVKKNKTITADQLLSDFVLDLLPSGTVALLKKTKVTVKSVTNKNKGVSATAKVGTSKGGGVAVASASSSVKVTS